MNKIHKHITVEDMVGNVSNTSNRKEEVTKNRLKP